MKGALVGFGTIARAHLATYLERTDLVITAIVDPCQELGKQVKSVANNINTYKTLEETFSAEKLDFIDICSPPDTHYGYIRSGLSNKCHVLCEKPFLLSSEQYRDLLPLIRSVDKVTYPCHNYKFAPTLQHIKRVVQSEQFGELLSGQFRTLRSGHAVGVSEWNPHWRRNRNISGGGILRDHGPHSVYIACEMYKKTPVAVSCIMGNLVNDQYSDTEDTALLTIYFDNNVQFTITLSWAAGYRNSYYAVIGSGESVILENNEILHTMNGNKVVRQSISSEFDDPSHKGWFQEMFSDFVDVVATPNRQLPLLQEALITTLIIEKAYLSAKYGGKLVDLPPVSDFGLNTMSFKAISFSGNDLS